MIYIGIDTGVHGAVAMLSSEGASVADVPTFIVRSTSGTKRSQYDLGALLALVEHADAHEPAVAVIERVHAQPDNGVHTAFLQGYGLALWEMALTAARIPYELVLPARWKPAIGIVKGSDKRASLVIARRLFPQLAGELARVKDDGRAEALLLAEYRRRLEPGT